MQNSEVKYCLNDKCIVPAVITTIESRSECYTRYDGGYNIVQSPIFTAPMCAVVDNDNYATWVENGIQAIIPRTVPWLTRCYHMENGHWVAVSQKEFYNYFCTEARVLRGPAQTYYICIDTANAHRKSIYDMVNEAKDYADKEGPVLYVSGCDLMDGTPIYDIKPYLPYTDSHPDASGGFTDTLADRSLEVSISDDLLSVIPEDKRETLIGVLAQDPRPSYQNDPQRKYGFSFADFEVGFKVEKNTLTVIKFEKNIKKLELFHNSSNQNKFN